MIQLFIPSIINSDWSRLNVLLTVLAVLYACVFLKFSKSSKLWNREDTEITTP